MGNGMTKPSILIVDDERAVRAALHRWFDACGYTVDVAEDGVEAVEKCTANTFDAVIMDLEMPRMSGAEALTAIKELQPELPVIVFTGYPGGHERTIYTGAARVLIKPLRLKDLEQEVRSLLEPSRSEG